MVDRIQLLRNIGQFDNVSPGQQTALSKLTFIYAENGRGKTTLSTILRSLGTNNASLIEERHRLGAEHRPHIVVQNDNKTHTFQNGAWQNALPEIVVFDDFFVDQNVCSGIDVDPTHRQNLHELIIGAQGLQLNAALKEQVSNIEEHNRLLGKKESAISPSIRGALTVDAFCVLKQREDLDAAIQQTERNIEAAKSADAIKQQSAFQTLSLPAIDIEAINALLQEDIGNLQQQAVSNVQQHLSKLGKDGEAWVNEGMSKISQTDSSSLETCPFCLQNLSTSPIIVHYQGYFSAAYSSLKERITTFGKSFAADHGADVQTAFERNVNTLRQLTDFWKRFADIPEVQIDTAEIALIWKEMREPVLALLREKLLAPLDKKSLSDQIIAAIHKYNQKRELIEQTSLQFQGYNPQIAVIKESATSANLSALNNDLTGLNLIRTRFLPETITLCDSYLAEKLAKKTTEKKRDKARQALENYRSDIFQKHQTAINLYLQKFIAGFRLDSMNYVNNRGGTSCVYNVVINNIAVPISSETGPSFKNTLSAGDRNTLALAFFFACLDKDPSLAQKIVVIDDPMTSLDEHRSLATINEIIELTKRVNKVIVLSHSKPFLCQLWNDAERAIKGTIKSALQIIRDGNSSTIENWNVHDDCITEHDKRHALVLAYIKRSDSSKQREVAAALRPTLEAFLRVAYPEHFPPGALLGEFRNKCLQAQSSGDAIMDQSLVTELESITNFANKFHHDTNTAYSTEIINDQTLLDFCKRTMSFIKK